MATIRVAGRADLATLAALRRAWTEEYVGEEIEDERFITAFTEWYDKEAHQRITWLADDRGHTVGMLNMLIFTRMPRPRRDDERPSQWGYIANVYVEPSSRDAGIGRQLLDAAVSRADAAGYARLLLSPSERSLPFYLRAGFMPATSLLVRPASSGDRRIDR